MLSSHAMQIPDLVISAPSSTTTSDAINNNLVFDNYVAGGTRSTLWNIWQAAVNDNLYWLTGGASNYV
jgi:hypothetical protein